MTEQEIIDLAEKAGVSIRAHYDESGSTPQELLRFATLVAEREREACAKVCVKVRNEWVLTVDGRRAAQDCVSAIRAHGNKENKQ